MAAAASDKARYYMEQSVPELQEYERKNIFTRDEIMSIAKKRSEFEHLINMPCKASDYVRYAQYEMNLDALRKKRCKKTGVKATAFTGQRKIFFILDRATKRFQGDMGLWMQYLEYCKREGARKKLSDAFTRCLRLHPMKYEIWIWVAKIYYEEQADMANARNYMQRGLRFCKREKKLWLEYAKLELLYLAKLDARNNILGLKVQRESKEDDSAAAPLDPDTDMIALPDVTAEDLQGGKDEDAEMREVQLKKVAESPALSGAIPRVIFDSAMSQFNNDPAVAEHFFDLFALFPHLPCVGSLLKHVIDHIAANPDRSGTSLVSLTICKAKREMLGWDWENCVSDSDGKFPLHLANFLKVIKNGMTTSPVHNALLAEKALYFILPFPGWNRPHADGGLDEDVYDVLGAAVKRYLRIMTEGPAKYGQTSPVEKITKMGNDFLKEERNYECQALMEFAAELHPDHSQELSKIGYLRGRHKLQAKRPDTVYKRPGKED